MRVTLIADGSYCHEYGVGGYGFWIVCERGRWGSGGPFKDPVPSSHAAEMMAVVNALHQGLKVGLIMEGDELLIQTDCRSAIQSFERSIGARTAFGTDSDAAQVFNKLRTRFKLTVRFRHVKGHTSIKEPRYAANRKCDERAKRGMRQARGVAKQQEHRREKLDKT